MPVAAAVTDVMSWREANQDVEGILCAPRWRAVGSIFSKTRPWRAVKSPARRTRRFHHPGKALQLFKPPRRSGSGGQYRAIIIMRGCYKAQGWLLRQRKLPSITRLIHEKKIAQTSTFGLRDFTARHARYSHVASTKVTRNEESNYQPQWWQGLFQVHSTSELRQRSGAEIISAQSAGGDNLPSAGVILLSSVLRTSTA